MDRVAAVFGAMFGGRGVDVHAADRILDGRGAAGAMMACGVGVVAMGVRGVGHGGLRLAMTRKSRVAGLSSIPSWGI